MCAFCDAAKRLLTKKNIPYKEINIALEEDKMEEMIKKSNGKRTIPPNLYRRLSCWWLRRIKSFRK